jgi:hypothetical protein
MTEQEVEEIVEAKTLETLGLSKRVYSRLIKAGMTDLKQLLEKLQQGDEEILALPGLGPKSLAEVKGKLQAVVAEEVGEPEAQVEPIPVTPSDSDSPESRKEAPMAEEKEKEKKTEEAKPEAKGKSKKKAEAKGKGKKKAEAKGKGKKKAEAKGKGKKKAETKGKGKKKAEAKGKGKKKAEAKGKGKKKKK